MALDTYDPILGLILPVTGNDNNSWGDIFNNSATKPVSRAIGGVNTIGATTGTVDLSGTLPPAGLRQDIDAIQLLNGVLVGNVTVIVPNVSKLWWFQNRTTGAFNVYVKVPGGVSPNGLVQIPQGVGTMVMGDGSGILTRLDKEKIGEFVHHANGAVPAGALLCNGASLLRTDYPDLFNAIGTQWGSVDGLHFTLPNLVDTGRFLRSYQTAATGAGQYQANQNVAHTHAMSGAPSVGSLSTDSQGSHSHTTNINDPTHVHSFNVQLFILPLQGAASSVGSSGGNFTNSAATGISVSINASGAHTHNVTGAPGLGTIATVSQGGAEARPEAAVCIIAIRY